MAPEQAVTEPVSRGFALGLASAAWLVPALMSGSTAPSPNHPRVLLWYKTLRQPPWKPPDIAIPLAWMGIETCLAAAAYRLLRRPGSPARTVSLGWLATNVVGIGAWSRLFFGKRNLAASTVAAAGLLGTSVAYVASAREEDPTAAAQGLPLVAWVAFATVLPRPSGIEIDDARGGFQQEAAWNCLTSCNGRPWS